MPLCEDGLCMCVCVCVGGGGVTYCSRSLFEETARDRSGSTMVSEYRQCMYLPVQSFPALHLVPLIEENFNTQTNASAEIGRRDYTMYSKIIHDGVEGGTLLLLYAVAVGGPC